MSCQAGEIKRKSYTRANGTHVKATCIPDRGQPGKGPKTLPPLDDKLHLSNYGYSASIPEESRHRALRAAIRDTRDILLVERHLNLIRNYQAESHIKKTFGEDVDYLKQLYAKYKSHKMKGGSGQVEDSEIFVKEEKCENGKCQQIITVKESHIVEKKEVVFYTLTLDDAEDIFKLDKEYLDSDITLDIVKEKLVANKNEFIGLRVDGSLEAYCQYKLNTDAKLVWFCANKTYGTPLYQFMEKFFSKNDFEIIRLSISLEGSYNVRRLNFWIHMGFIIDAIDNEKHQLSGIKKIN